MYCKFKDGDLVVVKRDTKTYYGARVRKWVCGTVMTHFAADSRYDGYVRILFGKGDELNRLFSLIPIKDLKKIKKKDIPTGHYTPPKFENGDVVWYYPTTSKHLYTVIDNKPYFDRRLVIVKNKENEILKLHEDTISAMKYYQKPKTVCCETRWTDDDLVDITRRDLAKRFLNSVYGMAIGDVKYVMQDTDGIDYRIKTKEDSKMKDMLDDNYFITFSRKGNTVTANLYETTIKNADISACKIVLGAEAKCHPDDKFDYKTGMMVALEKLEGKWRLMNKSNLQKFKDGGGIWVKTDKENFIDFMAICARRDISWSDASALGWIPNGLINGRPIYVKVDPETGYMFYQSYPLDSKSVITVSELLK